MAFDFAGALEFLLAIGTGSAGIHAERERESKREEEMDRNISGFLIGYVGAAVMLCAYSQTIVSTTQCIAIGLFILIFGLFVKEGLISL